MDEQTRAQIDILSQIIDLAFQINDSYTRMAITTKAIDLRTSLQLQGNPPKMF